MHDIKRGILKSGRSKKRVTNPIQAVAIGLSEARRSGAKVPSFPRKKSATKKLRRSRELIYNDTMKEITRRKLGSSDLMVSEISLGSWLTYSGGVDRDQTEKCTRAAYELGINFFDTANVYGRGISETAWGEILSTYPRDSYVLATKVFLPYLDADDDACQMRKGKLMDQLRA